MRLATLPNGTRDGSLVVVSSDGTRCIESAAAPNLLAALESWDTVEDSLRTLGRQLDVDQVAGAPFLEALALAPLPRTWEWLDASAFLNHGILLSRGLGIEPIISPVPLMYQGLSDQFLPPAAKVPFKSTGAEIDFEGEFAVILRAVPAGVSASDAEKYIALITVVNDWSLRQIAGDEIKRGFGFLQAKPPTGAAPLAVTPDELGAYWRGGRVRSALSIRLNGERFGDVPADQMDYSFGELIAFASENRDLPAGTILGSGTISSREYLDVGSACIAERRGIERIHHGGPITPFLQFGDRVEMWVDVQGRSLFGLLSQMVVDRASA
jgi:fumarylacetoacetate (FAA) hydrolase